MESQRYISLDKCRLTACLMVIMLHVAATGFFIDPDTTRWRAFNFADTMVRGCVPLFFMISGSLFLQKETLSTKKLFQKNIMNLVFLYLIWSVFYEIIACINGSHFQPASFFLAVIKGHYHLWFIPAMVTAYLVTPIIHHVLHGQKINSRYLLFLFGIITILTVNLALIPGLPTIAKTMLNKLDLTNIQYVGYMVWGYFLSRKQFGKKAKLISVAVYIICGILTAVANRQYSIAHGYAASWLYGYFTIPTFIQATAIYVYFQSNWPLREKAPAHFLQEVSGYTLGVYFLHPMILETLTKYGLDVKTGNPFYMIPAVFSATTIICFCIAFVYYRIKRKIKNVYNTSKRKEKNHQISPKIPRVIFTVLTVSLIILSIIPVTKISFSTENIKSMEAGTTQALSVQVPPWNIISKNLVWTSSDQSVATVDENGNVTALRPIESVDITATSADNKDISCTWNLKFTLNNGFLSNSSLDSLNLSSINKVMFVAHPDDELLWGGAHLLEDDYLIVCITHGWNEQRKSAFIDTVQKTKDKYIILNYPDAKKQFADGSYETDSLNTCRSALQKDIEQVLTYKKWEQVVTHNPKGEYGKYHHQQVSNIVTESFNKHCKNSSELWYFGRFYKLEESIPGKQIKSSLLTIKKQLIQRYYPTASGAIQAFGHMIPYENWIRASDW